MESFLLGILDFLTSIPPWVGYLIVFIGSFVEGETIVLSAGALAYKGYFSLPLLILISFTGSLLADQLLFFVGRHYGPGLIERHTRLKQGAARVFYHLRNHETLFILSFRFIYGIRVISPIIIGAGGVAVRRFMLLNFIAAAIWAVISCCAGYAIGYFLPDDISSFLKHLGAYQKYLAIILAVIASVVIFYIYIRKKMLKTHSVIDRVDRKDVNEDSF